jgi:hypothetical protein
MTRPIRLLGAPTDIGAGSRGIASLFGKSTLMRQASYNSAKALL